MQINPEPLIPAGLPEHSWAGSRALQLLQHHLGQDPLQIQGGFTKPAQVRGLCWGFAAAKASSGNKWVWQKDSEEGEGFTLLFVGKMNN